MVSERDNSVRAFKEFDLVAYAPDRDAPRCTWCRAASGILPRATRVSVDAARHTCTAHTRGASTRTLRTAPRDIAAVIAS